MGQFSAPFDAGAGAAVNESTWQKMSRAWLATGVVTGRLNQLAVSADGSALSVSVATGQAQVEGFFYENDAALALTIATANATNPRIDTVVVRLDRTANTAVLAVVTGTAAASPVAPALSLTDTLYEMALANVAVPAAAGVIVAGNVTDRRVLSKNAPTVDPFFSGIITSAGAIRQKALGSVLNWLSGGTAITGAGTPAAGSGGLAVQSGSSVVTTDANGNAQVIYPTAFPGGVIAVIPVSGDSPLQVTNIASTITATAFFVNVRNATGALVVSSSVRVNWLAVGY